MNNLINLVTIKFNNNREHTVDFCVCLCVFGNVVLIERNFYFRFKQKRINRNKTE